MPIRKPNNVYRSREYLTFAEVCRLLDAAKNTRYPVRNQALILLMFRHGLRVSEAIALRWDAVMLEERSLSIARLKGSIGGNHPMQDDEVKLLVELRSLNPDSYYLFVSERGDRLTVSGAARLIETAGKDAGLPLPVHPHMLRHSCGYFLAEQGLPTRDIQEYLGHRNIGNTVRYTAGNPARFNRIKWDDMGAG